MFLSKTYRYNLKPDDAILAGPQHNGLIEYCFKTFENQLKLTVGGATQNSIRTAQWVFDFYDKKRTLFLGSVGDDQYATMLEEQAKKDNVEPLYCKVKPAVDENNNLKYVEKIERDTHQTVETQQRESIQIIGQQQLNRTKTGVCMAFNTNNGQYRSMVTFLGAARELNASHLDNYMDKIKKSALVYCGGFLLTSSFDVLVKLGEFCHENDKKFALNLSAPYVCATFGDKIAQLIPSLDLIFCNEKELRELANYHHFGVSLPYNCKREPFPHSN